MQEFSSYLQSASSDLSLREVLQEPVSALLGVSDSTVAALGGIGVKSVFDLGSSSLFAQATAAVSASTSVFGSLPADVLTDAAAATPMSQVPDLPLESMRGLTAAKADALKTALDANTIREFALWPQRQIAHGMVSAAAGTTVDLDEDSQAEELRPRFGEYPTERVYYDSLVMLATEANPNLAPLDQPLSLEQIANEGIGFGKPAVGALATHSQSWFAQGITLGQMLHSLALAPGEATRIAVVDWARRTRAAVTETVAELEQLDNAMDHSRAVSEVQNAVANEMQSGGSMSSGWAKSTSSASGAAASLGGGLSGIGEGITGVLGISLGGSETNQNAETNSRASSTSWSVGSKSVLAEMTQRVNDRTEQHATSVRNRRASSVREVSESEHEDVSTRIVANYNHMHALSIQYYEVIQVYRVSVQLNKFERAIFLPFQLIDFSAADAMELVTRFRGQLLDAALTARVSDLLQDDRGRVEVRSAIRVDSPLNVAGFAKADVAATVRTASARIAPLPISPGGLPAVEAPLPVAPAPPRFTVVRPGPIAEVIPGDVSLVSAGFEGVGIERLCLDQPGVPAADSTFFVSPNTGQVDLTSPVPVRSIQGIQVGRDQGAQASGSMVLRYEAEGLQSIAVVPLALEDGTAMQQVAYLSGDTADRRAELLAHLQANRAYYTQAIFETLDSASLIMLLSGISWHGKPLTDQIEPHPLAVAGNYLVLRAPAEEGDIAGIDDTTTWGDLLKARNVTFEQEDVRLIPVPTGGVFAEAVLGRSNSAEKLDITRFWNWQDSPIPLQPPEIAPVSTDSRATPETLTPGQLGAPVLNLVNPTPLPDPAGLTAALNALANGSMFRDMSGLAGTQATAQAASAGTLDAATKAGQIASDNFKAATTQATEMGKAAADMWKVMKTSDATASGSQSKAGISGDGARINQGKNLDQRGVSGSTSSTPGSATTAEDQPPPIFAASSQVQPPTISRELAYSDEAVAASPALLGATTAALGSATSSALPATGGGLASGKFVIDVLFLQLLRELAVGAGLPIQGVELVPMQLHDNHLEFEPIYAAWTNSSTRIYVNTQGFLKLILDANTPPAATSDELKQMGQDVCNIMANAVFALRHELNHTTQFQTNGNKPPATYKKMIEFEAQAYANDAAWMSQQQNHDYLVKTIGADAAVVDKFVSDQAAEGTEFDGWKTSLTNEQVRKATLISKKLLPAALGTNSNYAIGDLYKTKEP